MPVASEIIEIPQDVRKSVNNLQKDYKDEEITQKGFVKKLKALVEKHLPEEASKKINQLEDDLKSEDITEKGFYNKLEKLLEEEPDKKINGKDESSSTKNKFSADKENDRNV